MAKNNSWAKKIARFNTTKAEQRKKEKLQEANHNDEMVVKKKWPKVVLGLAIVGVLVAGFAIPLSVAGAKYKKEKTNYNDDDVVYTVKVPNSDKTVELKYKDLKAINESASENSTIFNATSAQIYKYLYQQEYEASAKYNAIYNADKTLSEKKSLSLKSLKTIREAKQKEIETLKERFQKQFGYGKWESKFKEELAKENYGKSETEQEAVDYLVSKEIKTDALRRFSTEINTDFTIDEIKNGVKANADVIYHYWDEAANKEQTVTLAKKGEIIDLKDYFALSGDYVNTVLPTNNLNVLDETKAKAYIFVTKSFVASSRNATKYIEDWLKTKPVIYSQFNLNITQNQKSSDQLFTFAKNDLKKLLSFGSYANSDKNVIDLAINRLDSFAGITNIASGQNLTDEEALQAKNDTTLLENLGQNNASTYGSQGFRSLNEIYSKEKAEFYVPYTSIVQNNAIFTPHKLDNFFTNFKKLIVEKLFANSQELQTILNADAMEWSNENAQKAAEYNKRIGDYLDSLSNYESLIDEIIKQALQVNELNQVSSVYQIDENKFAFFTSSGLVFINTKTVTDKSNALALILSDLQRSANKNDNNALKPLFNMTNIFNSLFNENYEVLNMLANPDFVTYLKTQQYEKQTSSEKANFDDDTIAKAKQYVTSQQYASLISLLVAKNSEIKEYVNNLITKNLNADYEKVNNKWVVKDHTDKEYNQFIFSVIQKNLQGGN
ncbi:HinT-interacting membrane complex protein P80 [Mycoplasma sp. 1573]